MNSEDSSLVMLSTVRELLMCSKAACLKSMISSPFDASIKVSGTRHRERLTVTKAIHRFRTRGWNVRKTAERYGDYICFIPSLSASVS